MNYRHCYHAGNFADVVKHVTLITLLESMQRKATPFCFLDTHAGIGLYALHAIQAQKKQEYKNGIEKLLYADINLMPPEIQKYITLVKHYNSDNELNFYPGSPAIADALLRTQDQMILSELHKEDYQILKENFFKRKSIAVHHQDAYLSIKAFLPPKQKRGLVLIDPAFEVRNELTQIHAALQHALKHWRSGVFLIWYPIKDTALIDAFYRDIASLHVENVTVHFALNDAIEPGKLSQCGLLLINPPWKIKENLQENILPYLSEKLGMVQKTGILGYK